MMLPDLPDLIRLLQNAGTLERNLNGLRAEEIAQDLRDLHYMLQLMRKESSTIEQFIKGNRAS